MGQVVVDISTSLDGFVTGPRPGPSRGLGVGGEPLHAWAISERTVADAELLDDSVAKTGAVVMGRRTFVFIDGPHGWSDDLGYGAERDQTDSPPNFVVTHAPPVNPRHQVGFTFVTEGLTEALRQAQQVAGAKDVTIMGGADLARQALRDGLVDELTLHVAPIVLGAGTPLFHPPSADAEDEAVPILRFEQQRVLATRAATHLFYRVVV